MAKITIVLNNGRKKTMDAYYARALIHCGKAVRFRDYENKMITPAQYEEKSFLPDPVEDSDPVEDFVPVDEVDDTEEINQTAPKRRGRPKKIKDE